jgi:hypothetical protein
MRTEKRNRAWREIAAPEAAQPKVVLDLRLNMQLYECL